MPRSIIGKPRPTIELSGHTNIEPETGPVAMDVNAFYERYTVGRSKAYGLSVSIIFFLGSSLESADRFEGLTLTGQET